MVSKMTNSLACIRLLYSKPQDVILFFHAPQICQFFSFSIRYNFLRQQVIPYRMIFSSIERLFFNFAV